MAPGSDHSEDLETRIISKFGMGLAVSGPGLGRPAWPRPLAPAPGPAPGLLGRLGLAGPRPGPGPGAKAGRVPARVGLAGAWPPAPATPKA